MKSAEAVKSPLPPISETRAPTLESPVQPEPGPGAPEPPGHQSRGAHAWPMARLAGRALHAIAGLASERH
jgi:hypothetical protein